MLKLGTMHYLVPNSMLGDSRSFHSQYARQLVNTALMSKDLENKTLDIQVKTTLVGCDDKGNAMYDMEVNVGVTNV